MHYLANVRLREFYTKALPAQGEGPLVVHREKRVLDASASALELGVKLGMSLPEAKAVLDGRGEVRAWEPEPYREAQEKWLEICAAYTDVIEPLDQHEAFLDLTGHPRAGELVEALQAELSQKLGYRAKIGQARCRWVARVAATFGDPQGNALFLPDFYVASMPTECLIGIPPAYRQRLQFLGYRRIGEVAEVSLQTLQQQFGEIGYAIWEAAQGRGDAAVRADYPRDAFFARVSFDGPPEDTETLDHALKLLAKRVGERLREADAVGNELELFLESEEGSVRALRRSFIKPMDGPKAVYIAGTLLLNQPPKEQLAGMRMRLPNLRRRALVQLSADGTQKQNARCEAAEKAVSALRQVFGDHVVERASEVEQPRRVEVMRAWKDATGWR